MTQTRKSKVKRVSTPFSLMWHYVYEHIDNVFDPFLESRTSDFEVDEVEKIIIYSNNYVEIHGRKNNMPCKYIGILRENVVRCLRCQEKMTK